MLMEFDSRPSSKKDKVGCFERSYQRWYTEGRALISQLMPDRLEEFDSFYRGDARRKSIDRTSYTIQDWLTGIRSPEDHLDRKLFKDFVIVHNRFQTQLSILDSVAARFESTLFDIKQMAQADLFDSELDAARELAGCGFLRAAGVVAGVVLERHLRQVMDNHKITTRKKRPNISDYNELLKQNGILDVPSWRQIQRLGDVRNICGHDKEREPTEVEVEELIDGVEKYTKTLF